MPNKFISMNKLRQLLRLYSQGKGSKSIATLLCMSRTTVKKYLTRIKESGTELDQILNLSDQDLSKLLQDKELEDLPDR